MRRRERRAERRGERRSRRRSDKAASLRRGYRSRSERAVKGGQLDEQRLFLLLSWPCRRLLFIPRAQVRQQL
jgi:hypothetical protein